MQSVTHRRIQLFMIFVAIALPAVTSAAPVPASGTFDGCQFAPVFSAAGPNTVVTNGVTANFFGTLLGTYAGTQYSVNHADGRNTFHGSGIFTGAVAGRSGTATFRYEGMFPEEPFDATWVLVGETGSLASVTGHGTLVGTSDDATGACDLNTFSGSYEGALNLGP
jgi:hypothetical protein